MNTITTPKLVKVGKTKRKPHLFKSGYTKPFKANCTSCGANKQHEVHTLFSNGDKL